MAMLTVASGELAGKQYTLGDARFTIGRADTSSLVLNLSAVSNQHCAILRRRDRYALQDMGSTNGSLLNGVPVREALLKDGDRIGIGDVDILFEDATKPVASTGSTAAFAARRNTRWRGFAIGVTVGIVVVAAAVWFAFKLLNL